MILILCIIALIIFIIILFKKISRDFHNKIKDISRDDWMI